MHIKLMSTFSNLKYLRIESLHACKTEESSNEKTRIQEQGGYPSISSAPSLLLLLMHTVTLQHTSQVLASIWTAHPVSLVLCL